MHTYIQQKLTWSKLTKKRKKKTYNLIQKEEEERPRELLVIHYLAPDY